MTTSKQSRMGDAPEEGIKAPVVTLSTGNELRFGTGQTIASVVIGDMDRVALAAQTDSTENGIYVARGGKDWERATDMNLGEDVIDGQLITDSNTLAVYNITSSSSPWQPGIDSITFGLLLSPVGFFWGAITGTISNQADLQLELDAKAEVVHTHVEADITDLQAYLLDAAGSIAMDGEFYARQDAVWAVIDFSVFAPASHFHVEADISDLGQYILDAAGSIADDGLLYARLDGGWAAFSTASGNVGEITAWPHADVPDNFLDCNGQSVNAVTFSKLFAIIGYMYGGSGANFNLPDLRGQFIRGTANGSGNDPDRLARTDRGDGATGDLVGTKQNDTFQAHVHDLSGGGSDDDGGPRPPGGTSADSGSLNGAIKSTGGSETRPLNVNMNYIIRYEGGGSGNLPPEIVVQDDGVTLTQAVQGFNFIGFNITEPVDDQIEISFGASPNNATYCPNYAFNFISDTTWSIVGLDVTNLFSVGRRLRFVDGASNYFGTILSSAFGTDTTMSMSMEDGEVLTNSISEVCLVNGGVAWQPISEDPFGGTAIRGIATGNIGATEWWVACGDGGKIFSSQDGGLTWADNSPLLVDTLNDVAYNPDDESFLVVGDGGNLLHTVDCITFTLDFTALKALPEYVSGDADVYSVMYDFGGQGWRVQWSIEDTVGTANAYSTDDTATWDSTPNLGTRANVALAKIGNIQGAGGAGTGTGMFYQQNIDLWQFGIIPDESGATYVNVSSQGAVAGARTFVDQNGSTVRIFVGREDGEIFHNTTEVDTVTFGSSSVNAFAESPSLERMVAVADDGKIGTCEKGDYTTVDSWTLRQNGSNPLANFTDVDWNEADGIFVAVNDQGQILRSTNGLDTVAPVVITGWTLEAADPFSGSPINRITAGVIGGTNYWVAIGGGGILFTSIDAGVNWVSRTTGTTSALLSVFYESGSETFVVGCAGGDFVVSTDGTTWTVDNTTISGLAIGGSDDIDSISYDTAGGRWLFKVLDANGDGELWHTPDLVAFTVGATALGSVGTGQHMFRFFPNAAFGGNAIFVCAGQIDVQWLGGYADTTVASAMNRSVSDVSSMNFSVGTNGQFFDLIIGTVQGDLEMWDNTQRSDHPLAMDGQVNAAAFSSLANRWMACGAGNQMMTLAGANTENGNAWELVVTPFQAVINDMWYDSVDDIFMAVSEQGEIGTSVDGIS